MPGFRSRTTRIHLNQSAEIRAGARFNQISAPSHACRRDTEELPGRLGNSFLRRRQLIRNPDHLRDLLVQRRAARHQTLLLTFLSLSPHAEPYARKLEDKRLNAPHHLQKIVALSELYGPEKVDRALQDALSFEAYGCEYIANILEQRERLCAPPAALHLTRRQDLLDLELPAADLTPYEPKSQS